MKELFLTPRGEDLWLRMSGDQETDHRIYSYLIGSGVDPETFSLPERGNVRKLQVLTLIKYGELRRPKDLPRFWGPSSIGKAKQILDDLVKTDSVRLIEQ